jgi:hypothetical protein
MIPRERLHKPGWKILGVLFLVGLIMAAGYGVRAAGREMAFFRIRKFVAPNISRPTKSSLA